MPKFAVGDKVKFCFHSEKSKLITGVVEDDCGHCEEHFVPTYRVRLDETKTVWSLCETVLRPVE